MADPTLDLEHARWARARDEYRAGAPASEVCARYALPRSTFYARASAERWRRADLPGAAPPLPEADDFDAEAPRLPSPALADLAHRRITHAMTAGRVREALMWARLAKEMRGLALEEENASWRKLHREAKAAESAAAEALVATTEAANPASPPVREATASGAFGEALAVRTNPALCAGQATVSPDDSLAGLDCPDCLEPCETVPEAASAEEAPAGPSDGSGPPAGAPEDAACAEDWARWAQVRARLVAERPDLPWWTEPRDEEGGQDAGDATVGGERPP